MTRGRKPTHCKHCGRLPDWRGLQKHHLHGGSGRRTYSEWEYWCAPCHFGEDGHRIENMPHSKPTDRPQGMSGYHGSSGRPYTKEMQTGVALEKLLEDRQVAKLSASDYRKADKKCKENSK